MEYKEIEGTWKDVANYGNIKVGFYCICKYSLNIQSNVILQVNPHAIDKLYLFILYKGKKTFTNIVIYLWKLQIYQQNERNV
jgi:hypothetical protein